MKEGIVTQISDTGIGFVMCEGQLYKFSALDCPYATENDVVVFQPAVSTGWAHGVARKTQIVSDQLAMALDNLIAATRELGTQLQKLENNLQQRKTRPLAKDEQHLVDQFQLAISKDEAG